MLSIKKLAEVLRALTRNTDFEPDTDTHASKMNEVGIGKFSYGSGVVHRLKKPLADREKPSAIRW